MSATILPTPLQTLAPTLKPQFDIVTSPLQHRIIEQRQASDLTQHRSRSRDEDDEALAVLLRALSSFLAHAFDEAYVPLSPATWT